MKFKPKKEKRRKFRFYGLEINATKIVLKYLKKRWRFIKRRKQLRSNAPN